MPASEMGRAAVASILEPWIQSLVHALAMVMVLRVVYRSPFQLATRSPRISKQTELEAMLRE